jgi:phosphate-selective porin OprO/OprP
MKATYKQSLIATALVSVLALGALCVPSVFAQSPESEAPPAKGEFEPAPLPPLDVPYIIPDIPESTAQKMQFKSDWFTFRLGSVAISDYDAFQQDSKSLDQVGKQEDVWDPRSFRLMMRGTFGGGYKVKYFMAVAYKGFESEPEELWSWSDWNLTFPIGSPATTLMVGKGKEQFNYEMVGDTANLPQQERVLNPFFVSRTVGITLTRIFGENHRMRLAGGVYNDWFVKGDPFSESGTDFAARFSGLAWDHPDRYLHLGFSGRYAGADYHTLRYKAYPESNVTDAYLDTGKLSADHAWNLGLEALWTEGPFSVLAEYNRAWVISPESGNPEFYGYYFAGGWVLTGENRPYDRTAGYARRVMPKGRWGAPELVARFSHVDEDDGVVQGGKFDKTYVGIEWWATRHWKYGFGWGHTWLDRFRTTGVTDSFQTRIQWIF